MLSYLPIELIAKWLDGEKGDAILLLEANLRALVLKGQVRGSFNSSEVAQAHIRSLEELSYTVSFRCGFGSKGGRCSGKAVVLSKDGFPYCADHSAFCNAVAFNMLEPTRSEEPTPL